MMEKPERLLDMAVEEAKELEQARAINEEHRKLNGELREQLAFLRSLFGTRTLNTDEEFWFVRIMLTSADKERLRSMGVDIAPAIAPARARHPLTFPEHDQ